MINPRHFCVPGDPQGKGRARSVSRGGKIVCYTPDSTREYEERIKYCYLEQCKGEPVEKGVPLVMTLDVFYPVPEHTSEKRRSEMLHGVIRPTKKPDTDNVLKCIADALNGIAYHDDAQIVSVHVSKYYGPEGKVSVWISKAE